MAALSFSASLMKYWWFVIRFVARAVGRDDSLGLAVRRIDVHEVHVGAEVQFPAAELAHGNDRKPGGVSFRPAFSIDRPAIAFPQLRIGPFIGLLQADLGKVRQFRHRLLQVGLAEQVAQADPKHLLLAENASGRRNTSLSSGYRDSNAPNRSARAGCTCGMRKKLGIAKKSEAFVAVVIQGRWKESGLRRRSSGASEHVGVGAEKRCKTGDIVERAHEAFEIIERHVGIGGTGKDGNRSGRTSAQTVSPRLRSQIVQGSSAPAPGPGSRNAAIASCEGVI